MFSTQQKMNTDELKIVITHAYYIRDDEKEKSIMMPYVPLGLLYISAWLEKHHLNHEVYDTTFSSQIEHVKFITEYRPDIIAIYTNLMTKINVLTLIRSIRSTSSLSNSLIVLGGPDVTHNRDEYLSNGADLIIIGEGEETMREILEWYAENKQKHFAQIHGLAYKDPTGTVISTPVREKIKCLDDIPFPNRKKVDLLPYLKTFKTHHGYSSLSISTQRGCPYSCNWCSTSVYGQSYRRRSPENVLAEIIEMQQHYSPDQFWFVDDVFTINFNWMREFEELVQKRKIAIQYECITRADRLDENIIDLLKNSGCKTVWIGIESGSQQILDNMNRRVLVDQSTEMIVLAKRKGLKVGTFIMLGYPGETDDDIIKTREFLRISSPDHFTITTVYPIKGTRLHQQTMNDHIKGNWASSTDKEIKFNMTYHKTYYDFAIRWIVNSIKWHQSHGKNDTPFVMTLIWRLKIAISRFGMILTRKLL